jgi:excisionase family DNA binding protein
MADEPEQQLLDVPAAARFLGISERGVYRLVSSRRLPAYRVGCQLRFDEQELRDALRADRCSA